MATISGNISGTLAGDTLYYVSDDLTVPSGETLTIAAGAQVLFQGDLQLDGQWYTAGERLRRATRLYSHQVTW
jgi:hypothetical protein